MIGKIMPEQTLILRETVGSMEQGDDLAYELTTSVTDRSPLVCSKQTGKYFSLRWTDIVKLAQEGGIDSE